jgi:hypothetical protein
MACQVRGFHAKREGVIATTAYLLLPASLAGLPGD